MTVKRTERGWPGHFIMGHECRFRRNTLLQTDDQAIIVSTVGNLNWRGKPETVGSNRYYETMAFKAKHDGVYIDINVSQQVGFESEWAIDHVDDKNHEGTDNEANDMHEAVVAEFIQRLESAERILSYAE